MLSFPVPRRTFALCIPRYSRSTHVFFFSSVESIARTIARSRRTMTLHVQSSLSSLFSGKEQHYEILKNKKTKKRTLADCNVSQEMLYFHLEHRGYVHATIAMLSATFCHAATKNGSCDWLSTLPSIHRRLSSLFFFHPLFITTSLSDSLVFLSFYPPLGNSATWDSSNTNSCDTHVERYTTCHFSFKVGLLYSLFLENIFRAKFIWNCLNFHAKIIRVFIQNAYQLN